MMFRHDFDRGPIILKLSHWCMFYIEMLEIHRYFQAIAYSVSCHRVNSKMQNKPRGNSNAWQHWKSISEETIMKPVKYFLWINFTAIFNYCAINVSLLHQQGCGRRSTRVSSQTDFWCHLWDTLITGRQTYNHFSRKS